MSLRNGFAFLVTLIALSQTGCHCCSCWPCGKTWCGSQCGEFYWNEWFSIPPDCCDPCTNCGAFCGPNNRYLRRGVFSVYGDGPERYADNGYDNSDRGRQPAEVRGREELPPARPSPAREELPADDSTSSADYYNEFGQQTSYQLPVDSPGGSRTLGRPPRSRLIARRLAP